MSGTASMLLRQSLLAAYFTPDNYVGPGTLFVALANGTPLVNSSGSVVNEPTTGGYARVPVPLDSDHWTITPFGEVVTSQDTVFATPTEEWGLLTSWVLLDAPIGGSLLSSGSLIPPTYFIAGQDPPIVAAGLIVTGLYD